MLISVPKTPEQTPRKAGSNRSFSAASASNRAQPIAEIGATEGVETLFTHPRGKIVKFTSSASTRPSSSSGPWSPDETQRGTLPWATLTEKTMAAGPLEIYRVPGSVSFLHSGSLLHAILPRSNCWCVDGISKFAMRVLPDTYYRIELPGETPEDLVRVEEFKVTLRKVLFYERTPCPFARTFTVELPEEGQPKPRKRRRRTDGPAKKWKFDKAYSWKPEGWTPDQGGPSDGSSGSVTASDEEGSSGSPEEHLDELADQVKELNVQTPCPARKPSVRDRARGIDLRSVTAPAQLSLQSTPPSRKRTSFPANDAAQPRPTSRPPVVEAGQLEFEPGTSREESSHDPIQVTPNDMPPPLVTRVTSTLAPKPAIFQSQEITEPGSGHDHRALQPIPTDMPPSPPDSSVDFDYVSSIDFSTRDTFRHEENSHAQQSIAHHPTLADAASMPVILHEGLASSQDSGSSALHSGQLETDPDPHYAAQVDLTFTPSAPRAIFEGAQDNASFITHDSLNHHLPDDGQVGSQIAADASIDSLPETQDNGNTLLQATNQDLAEALIRDRSSGEVYGTTQIFKEQSLENIDTPPARTSNAHLSRVVSSETDPFAAIQARIQARRSIGESTTTFVPTQRDSTRLSAIPTASSSSLHSQLSKRSQAKSDKDQAVATALVKKAASAFLGPPVHLVAIMLKIAARFAKGAFPKALLFESPAGMPKRVPGSFDLDDSDIEDEFGSGDELDDNEDDFGVPLRSPIRLASGESLPRMIVESSGKERKGWSVEQ